MPTADREGLRVEMARALCVAHGTNPDCQHEGSAPDGAVDGYWRRPSTAIRPLGKVPWHFGWRKHIATADALITGPLAETLAQADTAARMADDLVAVGLRNLALSAEVEALRGALEDTRAAADDLVPVCLQEGDNRAAGALQYVSGFISDRLAALAAGQDKEGGKLTDAGRLALAEQEKARG